MYHYVTILYYDTVYYCIVLIKLSQKICSVYCVYYMYMELVNQFDLLKRQPKKPGSDERRNPFLMVEHNIILLLCIVII